MTTSRRKQLTWDARGVERMEFFMAEQIAYHVIERVQEEWSDREDDLIEKLRCVQGDFMDGRATPDYLRHSVYVAGNIMGNMMAQELMKLLLPPEIIAGIAEDAIERAIKDEEYDREHKYPEEYEVLLVKIKELLALTAADSPHPPPPNLQAPASRARKAASASSSVRAPAK